jgi:EAL domain-containing protein (putative c-di-GMP-specific phosphodiesterase class I)
VSWFTHELGESLAYRSSVLAGIDDAITQRQIVPWFQPIVDLEDGSLHGFEALARWQHPELGLILPDVFIEVAAEAGCLHRLDALMLESSLDQLKIWSAAGKHYTVHINLSGTSVLPGLERTVIDMLKERGLTSDRIALELTETNILNLDQQTKEVLDSLSAAGIAIHLDDFGTGFSSLTHLHDLPISGIKIDRSFLINYPGNKRSVALVNTVLNLAQTLDLEVVSEGIETEEQHQWIASEGSRYGQGYLYGKPAPADSCEHSALSWAHEFNRAA